MSKSAYTQHGGKVVETDGQFSHVMAVALDPTTNFKRGVIRCITSRTGDPSKSGNVDRSKLYYVEADDLEHIRITKEIVIGNQEKIVAELNALEKGLDFIGLEDPDLFFDEDTKLLHLYFTMPYIHATGKKDTIVHLGHAVGKDIDSLTMTEPAVMADMNDKDHPGAKELSVAPKNKSGTRINLIESYNKRKGVGYSVVRRTIAEDMGKPWIFGPTVFHPNDQDISWIAGHASPGPLLPKSFIDLGGNKMLGIMNGRGGNKRVGKDVVYAHFTVGLFIYDYEVGKIDWVSPEFLIEDTEAKNITLASQFIETGKGEGILYAHVDDSFVRAYTLYADGLKELLPK